MKFLRVIFAAGLLALSACGLQVAGIQTPPAPKTAEQSLFETKAGLDVAILQATAYANLPRCGSALATTVCSTTPLAQKLYDLADAANKSIDAGRVAVALVKATAQPSVSDQQKAQDAATAAAAALQQLLGALTILQKA